MTRIFLSSFLPENAQIDTQESNLYSQKRLDLAIGQIAASNHYRAMAVTAQHISHSLIGAAFLTALFSQACYGYNDKYAVSLSLFISSSIPKAFEYFFSQKMAGLRSQAQSNIDLANGRKITHLGKFTDPTISS